MPEAEHDWPWATRDERAPALVSEPPRRSTVTFREAMVRAGLRQDILPEFRPVTGAQGGPEGPQDGPGRPQGPGVAVGDTPGPQDPLAPVWDGLEVDDR